MVDPDLLEAAKAVSASNMTHLLRHLPQVSRK
jgi:hypothetical protein